MGQFVGFHTSSVNVFDSDILNTTTEGEPQKPIDPTQVQSTQLIKHLFKPVTPVNPSLLDQLLQGHSNRVLVQEVVTGFQQGFSLKYNGLRGNHQPHNLLFLIQRSCGTVL